VVRQWIQEGSDVAHFRMVVGYRNNGRVLICNDSYRGERISCSDGEFLRLWEPFLFEYLVVYPPEKAGVVSAIIGSHWDEERMKALALEHAGRMCKERPRDAYAWYDLGRAYFLADDMPKAADAFEKAISLGLPPRFFWYQYEALWAFNRVGRYQEVLDISSQVLSKAPSIAEVHLARGDAFMGLGRKEKAIAEYRLALKYQPTLNQAKIRLFSLGACDRNHNHW
jgi:tetratricopeptide (TPR) repeat protein